MWNPAYIEELEPRDSLDSISGESQIITAPASDDGATAEGVVDEPDDGGSTEEAEVDVKQVLQEAVRSLSRLNDGLRSVLSLSRDRSDAVPDVDAYDTGKAIRREFRRFPNPSRKGMQDRLYNKVWSLLRLLQERVNQGTYDRTDVKLIEGLHVIHVLHARLSVCAETAIEHARRP